MSDIIEGLGTAAEGGLLARAVEPGAGRAQTDGTGHFGESACLNCATELIGTHCHVCGQRAHLHRTIGAFLHDLVHGVLHLDGKTWRTLPQLFFKPGELTRRYIAGERARFVSPMALFLFSIFLMFAVFQIAGITTPTDFEDVTVDRTKLAQAGDSAHRQTADQRARLEAERKALAPGSPRIAEIERELAELDTADGLVGAVESFALEDKTNRGWKLTGEPSGIALLDKGLAKWSRNPGLMLYKLQANFYKFSWLLIPLSLPFVWLLFAFRRAYKGYDHAVFVTYSLSFVTLLFIVLALLGLAGVSSAWLIPAAVLLPPVHIYKQLRQAYALSRFGALWRLGALMIFIVIILVLFLQLLVLLGLMG